MSFALLNYFVGIKILNVKNLKIKYIGNSLRYSTVKNNSYDSIHYL